MWAEAAAREKTGVSIRLPPIGSARSARGATANLKLTFHLDLDHAAGPIREA